MSKTITRTVTTYDYAVMKAEGSEVKQLGILSQLTKSSKEALAKARTIYGESVSIVLLEPRRKKLSMRLEEFVAMADEETGGSENE